MAISNILTNPTSWHPVFRANQVLTEAQLNQMIDYLDKQDRLTRVLLLGTGIAYGFEPVWVEATADTPKGLEVSAGFGVTCDGYLVCEAPTRLDRWEEVSIPVALFNFDQPETQTNSVFSQVYELSRYDPDAFNANPDETNQLEKGDLKNKVLVYLLEVTNLSNQGLCNNDCDARGTRREYKLRKLLFSEDQARSILACTYHVDKVTTPAFEKQFYFKYFRPHLAVPRFGYEEDPDKNITVKLDNIYDFQDFKKKYTHILKKYIVELSGALEQAHQVFSPLLAPEVDGVLPLTLTALSTRISTEDYDILEIQYLYDHLADLTDAYQEFVEVAFDLVADCNFNAKDFPNHLMVRKFGADGNLEPEPYSVFRTPYTQPYIYNQNGSRFEEARTLFNRLHALVARYTTPNVVGEGEIRVTPGKSFRAPLSERAVPCYYAPEMKEVWNARRNRFNRTGQVYSYHRPAARPYNDPLVYEMEGSDFFRIEGCNGRDFMDAMSKLNEIRLQYNLPFQVAALKIDDHFDGDPFQFECEDIECEMKELQDKYLELRADLLNTKDKVLVTKALLDELPERLDKFDYTRFSGLYEKEQLPTDTARDALEQINSCYQKIKDRMTEIRNRHLFSHFAGEYPGMDHKGGVPAGGTFILVYVDASAVEHKIKEIADQATEPLIRQSVLQRRMVVGDFYLPYACCSGCPPICYVVPRPKPIFFINPPNIFCSTDTAEKVLSITVHPSGGKIDDAPGYRFENGRHLFVPALAGPPDANGQIRLRYRVDCGEAIAFIGLVAPPAADFAILLDGEPKEQICEGQGPVTLEPSGTLGGQFYLVEADGTETLLPDSTYDPSTIIVPPGQPATLAIRYRVSGDYCDNIINKTLTVQPLPNPNFHLAGGVTKICREEGRVQLIPDEPGGTFTAEVSGTPAPGLIVTGQGTFLNPEALDMDPGQIVAVSVRHTITTALGCPNTREHKIQVYARPTAAFLIEDKDKLVCQTAPPVKLKISSPTPFITDAQFTAAFNGKTVDLPTYEFNPGLVANPSVEGTPVVIRLTVRQGPCAEVSTEQTIRVLPVPQPDFDFELIEEPGANFILTRVSNVKPLPGAKLKWVSNPESLDNIPPSAGSTDFVLRYGLDDELTIELTLEADRGGCSGSVTKTLHVSSNAANRTEEMINFLRRRDTAYRNEVKDLGENQKLAQLPAFQIAAGFVNFSGNVEEFNNRYKATAAALLDAATKTKAGTALHGQLLRLMAVTTQYFMDKQVFQQPDQLSPVTASTLQAQLLAMKKAGVKTAGLKSAWKGEELQKNLSAKSVGAILKLLK